MYTFALLLLELTLREVVTDIPHDFTAVVTYTILALFVGGIWYGSRGSAQPTESTTDHTEDRA